MGQDVAKFSAFMDRPRRFGSAMTPDASRKRKLPEEFPQPLRILAFFRIHLRVGSFEVGRTENARSAMARARQKDHVQVVFLDELRPQRLRQQNIVEQINHAQAEVIAGTPVDIRIAQLLGAKRFSGDGRSGFTVGSERRNFGGDIGSEGAHKMTPETWLML